MFSRLRWGVPRPSPLILRHGIFRSGGFRPGIFRPAVLGPALAALLAAAGAALPISAPAADWRFSLRFSPQVHQAPYSGRVYLFFSEQRRQPRRDLDWFHPEEFIAKDVKGWKPGETLELAGGDKQILAYPSRAAIDNLPDCRAQAVVRFNPFERQIGEGPGNGYSQVVVIKHSANENPPQTFVVDRLVASPRFIETPFRKELTVRSKLLSEFFGREVRLAAAVVLPPGYDSGETRRYPAILTVSGFGGSHYPGPNDPLFPEATRKGVDFIRVALDANCPTGHHVFADSANNGPVGQALVTEFLPALDRAFRTVADPRARFLTGHSSGGWSTLWLQIAYPETFGGTWSTSPDPVDFRDFQGIDLYRPGENLYFDHSGRPRSLARLGGKVVLTFPRFARMEDVLGTGGQLHSFEAVFSPRGAGGRPQPLWDTETGAIHADIAKSWGRYDIRLVLERNWKELGPKLAGKIHVFTGSEDTFYLDGAARLLKKSLAGLGSDAVVEIVPDKSHFDLLGPVLFRRIRREMAEAFLKAFPARHPARS